MVVRRREGRIEATMSARQWVMFGAAVLGLHSLIVGIPLGLATGDWFLVGFSAVVVAGATPAMRWAYSVLKEN